jgi:hypothetical protein
MSLGAAPSRSVTRGGRATAKHPALLRALAAAPSLVVEARQRGQCGRVIAIPGTLRADSGGAAALAPSSRISSNTRGSSWATGKCVGGTPPIHTSFARALFWGHNLGVGSTVHAEPGERGTPYRGRLRCRPWGGPRRGPRRRGRFCAAATGRTVIRIESARLRRRCVTGANVNEAGESVSNPILLHQHPEISKSYERWAGLRTVAINVPGPA